ncbi:MAG: carbohydrate porin [Candidatus Omnitrophica bacterium]|nr:carbohydrate porin [Candidatus Omnitrophota bacterium]
MKKFLVLTFVTFFAVQPAGLSFAQTSTGDDILKELRELKETVKAQETRISELETKLAEQSKAASSAPQTQANTGGFGEKEISCIKQCLLPEVNKEVKSQVDAELDRRDIRIAENGYVVPGGLQIGADGTFIFQGTRNANNSGEKRDDRVDGSWTSDITMSKDFSLDQLGKGKAFLSIEAGENSGLTDELSLFSGTNYDAEDSGSALRMTNLWYWHEILDGQIGFRAGKIDLVYYSIDQNNFAHDETAQFMSNMFVYSPAIEFAAGGGLNRAPGASVTLRPNFAKYAELSAGYYNADGTWDDIFNHPFYTTQFNFMPNELMGWDAEQWGGNYRVYCWENDRKHLKLVDASGGEPSTETNEPNYGYGFSADQKLTDVYGVFGRFGWQRPDLQPIDGSATIYLAWSTGAQMTGKYWNRPDDVFAFAVGQAVPSHEYKVAGNPGYPETHFESYYNFRLSKYMSLSPDLQWIIDPNGVGRSEQGDNDPIFVYGLRAQLVF